jgi:hypothetical protein
LRCRRTHIPGIPDTKGVTSDAKTTPSGGAGETTVDGTEAERLTRLVALTKVRG